MFSVKTLQRKRSIRRPLVTDSLKLELVAKWGQNSDPETVAQAMYEMNTTDLRADIARIKSPRLVIGTWIGYQQYTSRERVEKVFQEQYAKLKGFQFVMSETGKHFVMYDDPKLLKMTDGFQNARIRAFYEEARTK
ncbi:MAG TPA: hypothetical protein VF692_00045 [Pyrinomonadaceae bacterium]